MPSFESAVGLVIHTRRISLGAGSYALGGAARTGGALAPAAGRASGAPFAGSPFGCLGSPSSVGAPGAFGAGAGRGDGAAAEAGAGAGAGFAAGGGGGFDEFAIDAHVGISRERAALCADEAQATPGSCVPLTPLFQTPFLHYFWY